MEKQLNKYEKYIYSTINMFLSIIPFTKKDEKLYDIDPQLEELYNKNVVKPAILSGKANKTSTQSKEYFDENKR